MAMNWSIHAVGTCKENIKGFDLDTLKMDNADRGDYMHLVDDRVGMVITRWKDSKVLQAINTVMQPEATTVTRHLG
eukprot:1712071-Ditylum_brightwellii.AAC.1